MGTDVNSAPCDKSTFKLVLGVTQQFSGVSWVPNRFWRLLSDCVKEGLACEYFYRHRKGLYLCFYT